MNTQYNDPKGAAGALKTPLGLIPPFAMEQTAWAHKLGAEKYGPFNWRKTGVCASTYVNAILRHLNAWRDGETVDPESGISHLAHVACSCNILLDAGFCGTLQDDRNITPNNELTRITEDLLKKWDKEKQVRKMDKPIPYTEYRLLEVGELIQDGDEFYSETADMWFSTNIGNTLTKSTSATKHRRKVETVEEPIPYTEYRLLKEGEIIQEGDEFLRPSSNEWECTTRVGCTNTGAVNYRRKVEASNEPELCTCGRIKINHFMLGLICEDCEVRWQDPY